MLLSLFGNNVFFQKWIFWISGLVVWMRFARGLHSALALALPVALDNLSRVLQYDRDCEREHYGRFLSLLFLSMLRLLMIVLDLI